MTMRDEVFSYLNKLRGSGTTNMFGAVPFILKRFPDLSRGEASTYLGQWMDSFDE